MVKYRIDYEDGNYDIIKCPECKSEELTHEHKEGHLLDMICTTCRARFKIDEEDKDIIQVEVEEKSKESPTILTREAVKEQLEYEKSAKRLRKKIRE